MSRVLRGAECDKLSWVTGCHSEGDVGLASTTYLLLVSSTKT